MPRKKDSPKPGFIIQGWEQPVFTFDNDRFSKARKKRHATTTNFKESSLSLGQPTPTPEPELDIPIPGLKQPNVFPHARNSAQSNPFGHVSSIGLGKLKHRRPSHSRKQQSLLDHGFQVFDKGRDSISQGIDIILRKGGEEVRRDRNPLDDFFRKAQDRVQDEWSGFSDKVHRGVDEVRERMEPVWEWTRDMAQNGLDWGRQRAEEVSEWAEEYAQRDFEHRRLRSLKTRRQLQNLHRGLRRAWYDRSDEDRKWRIASRNFLQIAWDDLVKGSSEGWEDLQEQVPAFFRTGAAYARPIGRIALEEIGVSRMPPALQTVYDIANDQFVDPVAEPGKAWRRALFGKLGDLERYDGYTQMLQKVENELREQQERRHR